MDEDICQHEHTHTGAVTVTTEVDGKEVGQSVQQGVICDDCGDCIESW